MKKSLHDIGLKHGTDQAGLHNYLRRLEPYFEPLRNTPIRLLEIGVGEGKSLKTWAEYFPKAKIVGIDCDPSCKREYGKRILVSIGNVVHDAWNKLALLTPLHFDIVIDDGAHYAAAAETVFQNAFPMLVSDGIYVVEDLHACWDPNINPPGQSSTLDYFQGVLHGMNDHGEGQCGNPDKGASQIAFMHYSKSLLVIGKK